MMLRHFHTLTLLLPLLRHFAAFAAFIERCCLFLITLRQLPPMLSLLPCC